MNFLISPSTATVKNARRIELQSKSHILFYWSFGIDGNILEKAYGSIRIIPLRKDIRNAWCRPSPS